LDDSVFAGETFDVICAWDVLEHIHDVTSFMATLHKRLNPGGCVFLSTPNYGSHWMWRDIEADPRSRPPVHLTFWSPASLGKHLRAIGFDPVSVRPFSIPLNAARRSGPSWMRRLFHVECALRPSQRQTLLGKGKKPLDAALR